MSNRSFEPERKQSRRWGIVFMILPFGGVLCLAILLFFQNSNPATTSAFVPVNLHSQREANYSANPNSIPVPGVQLEIIWDTLQDREPGLTNLADRQVTLLNNLLTPVPTVTPSFSACQGVHFIYADQDTWIDSANPTAAHGTESLLQIGRAGNNTKHLLLHFPLEDFISPNTLIHSARLEMDVEQIVGSASPHSLAFFNLTSPFGEINTNWSNQPQPGNHYQVDELALGTIQVWDVTDIVRDWLGHGSINQGIVVGPQAAADFTFVYYGREIISQVHLNSNNIAVPVGPRLIVNCGGELPQAVSVNLPTPTPTATRPQPTATPASAKPLPTQTPLPTPTSPLPTPALPPAPTAALPAPTQLPPPSIPRPPTNTPAPPGHGGGEGGGGGENSPPPPPPSANLALSITDSHDPAVAGGSVTYTVTIRNHGPNNATNVTVTDVLPQGVNLISATGSQGAGCSGNSTLVCHLGGIASGAHATITVVVAINSSTTGVLTTSATVSANENDPAPGNNSALETTLVNSVTDLTLSKADSIDPVVAGGSLTYTLTISNIGPSDATGVIITDTLPISTAFVSVSAGCTHAGGIITCNAGSLGAGSSRQITVSLTVNPAVADGTVITNTATASGAETDPIPGNNTAIEATTINKVTDLIISKVGNPDPVIAGQALTYTLSMTNAGPSDATGVVLTDTLPAGVTFASASVGCVPAGSTVTCPIATLNAGSSLQRTIVVTVNAATTGSLTNTATMGGNETDPLPGNNTATITTTVQTEADLIISKVGSPDPVIAGQALTYTLSMTNAGPSDATGVVLTDTLPAGVTFASASAGCVPAGSTVTCPIATLNAGSSLQRTIVVTVNAATTGSLTNTATMGGNETDPLPGNNTATITTTVVGSANLGLSKQDSSDPVVPGGTFTYTLVAINNGPSDAANVSVSDTLPVSVSLVASSTTQGTGCSSASNITCNLGALASGNSATITLIVTINPAATAGLVNTASITSTTADPNLSDNTVSENTDVGVLALTKTSGAGGPLNPGQIFTYTLTVENIGSAVETNVTISDTLPAGLSYVPGSTVITAPVIKTVRDEFSAIAYNGNNGSDNWSANWLEIGEATNPNSGLVQVVANSRCAAGNCIRIGGLSVFITGAGLLREANLAGARSAFLTFNYRRQLLLLSGGNMSAEVSGNGGGSWTNLNTYNLNTNDSTSIPQSFDITPYIATNTQMRFIGGGGLIDSHFFADNVQIQYSQGITTVTGAPPPVVASGYTLLPGDVMTVTFQVMVNNPLTPTIATITNTASVTSNLQTSPLTDTVANPVQRADLTLTKSDSPDPVVAGQALTYTLSITNNGPFTAQSVVVTDTLPASLTLTGASPATTTQSGQTVAWNLGLLASGASQPIVISGTVDSGFSGLLTNTAIVTSATLDPGPAANSATVTTTVVAPADLQISKHDSADPTLIGQPFTYTLLITNGGPAAATGVTMVDTLPAGVLFGSATASQGPGCNQAAGIVTCALGAITRTGLPLVQSTFDSSAESWTIFDNGGSTTPDYVAAGGNPGGHISDVDETSGDFYFVAPAKFLGNHSAAYLGTLEFDLQRTAGTTYLLPADVILSGGGITVASQIAAPAAGWAHYTLSLHESAWLNTLTDNPASQQEMLTVLSNLTALYIRGDFVTGTTDSGALDNVMLTYGPARVTVVVTPTGLGGITNGASVAANEPDLNPANNATSESTTILPGLSIGDVSITEGNSGTKTAVFTVTLSVSSAQMVTVTYATANGTARTDNFDYNAIGNTLTFLPGITVQTFAVVINGDTLEEADELFFATLSNPINAILVDNQAAGTILNDDNDPDEFTVCSLPTKDAYFHQDSPSHNHSTDKELKIKPDTGKAHHIVMEFSLATIPVGSNVLTSTLFLYEESTQSNQTIHLHRLTNSWVDSQVSWNERSSGVPWATPGGDYITSTTVATFTPNIDNQYRQINVTNVTQGWVNGSFTNFGLLLRSTGDDGEVKFRSKEEDNPSKQPQLCVTYALPQAELAVVKSVNNPTPHETNTLVFTVTVTNNGPANSTGVILSDSLPSGLTYVGHNPSQGIYTNTTGIWNIGSITSSASATLLLTATVNAGTSGTPITNTATISSLGQVDPIPANNTASVVITPTLPTLSISDATVTEGDAGTSNAVFTVTLSASSAQTVTVNYSTADNTAINGSDYVTQSGIITLTPGITSQNIIISVLGDTTAEISETFLVNLSNPTNATITDGQGAGTIIDNDLPAISINNISITEGNAGTLNGFFTLSLSSASSSVVSVDYVTGDETATVGGGDYFTSSGTINIPAGLLTVPLTITIQSDLTQESNETFFVQLSNPINAVIADGQGQVTIIDDDQSTAACAGTDVTITTVKDTWLHQGSPNQNMGNDSNLHVDPSAGVRKHSLIEFDLSPVTIGNAIACATLLIDEKDIDAGQTISIHRLTNNWTEGNGSAGSGADWQDRTGTDAWNNQGGDFDPVAAASFPANSTGVRTINLTPLVHFWAANPGLNYGLLMQSATGSNDIQFKSEDDGTGTPPRIAIEYFRESLSISDVSVTEGNSGTVPAVFTVTLSAVSGLTVTVNYNTADGTATVADNDYLPASGVLTFTPGIVSQLISVTVVGDVTPESTETFTVTLSSPTNATLADSEGIGTITQDVGGLALPLPLENQIFLPLILKSD